MPDPDAFSREVIVGGRTIARGRPAFVIAEIGSNHDQSLERAVELIEAAARAGADAVKFQSLRLDRQYAPSETNPELRRLFDQIELDETWYPSLARASAQHGVLWFSSATFPEAIEPLVMHGACAIKIASAQFDLHPDVVEAAARSGLPLIMSAGLADIGGVARALDVAQGAGARDVILLHCVSEYPCEPKSCNLRLMATYDEAFGCLVGWSDHTLGVATVTAAAALGATVIEKHITLDRRRTGPDHHFAMEPAEFASMVKGIREAEAARGDGRARPLTPEARGLRAQLEAKLVTRRAFRKGDPITADGLRSLRLAGGVPRRHLDLVTSGTASRDLAADAPLTWQDVSFPDDAAGRAVRGPDAR